MNEIKLIAKRLSALFSARQDYNNSLKPPLIKAENEKAPQLIQLLGFSYVITVPTQQCHWSVRINLLKIAYLNREANIRSVSDVRGMLLHAVLSYISFFVQPSSSLKLFPPRSSRAQLTKVGIYEVCPPAVS